MTHRIGPRGLLAWVVACALGSPWAAQAAGTGKQTHVTHEQQLEQRVSQLEQELAELKAMIQEQKQATAQASQTAQSAQATAEATQTKVAAMPPPSKPQFTTAPGMSVALHGFISATAFGQDKSFTFGNGQNAEYPVSGSKGSLSGFDVRNTRFWLDFSGAKFTGDWVGGGRIEMDFFGGFNGTGAYSRQQPTPRLRQAYMDLINPTTGSTVRIGQQWDLMFPLDNVPTSLTHIAFPLGFGTGFVGWRFPGVVWMQELNHGSEGAKWRLDLGAFDGSWNGPNAATSNTNWLTGANAGFRPQVEARLRVQDKTWLAYLVAHYSEVNLKGVGNQAIAPVQDKVHSVGYEIGGQWKPGPWTFKGLAYSGKGLGEIFGDLSQFGDIKEAGGFIQAGYNFTPNWSANAFYGMSKPDKGDVIDWLGNGATGLLKSRQAALSLQYAAGAYELGIEWMYDKLDSTSNGVNHRTTDGNQISLSGEYKF
jgi:hypothetical protein